MEPIWFYKQKVFMLLHGKWDTKLGVSGHAKESHSKEERIINQVYKKHCDGTMEALRMLSKTHFQTKKKVWTTQISGTKGKLT